MSAPTAVDPVISVEQLQKQLASERHVVVLDVRRDSDGDRRDRYETGHIPGAHFVDFATELAGPRFPGSGNNPLPDKATVRASVEKWGIHDDTLVVVYTEASPATATRGWWVLRWAGLADVRYLDGGLPAWVASGAELSADEPEEGGGTAALALGSLPTVDAHGAAAAARDALLLDARPSSAYEGAGGGGHIPGAISLPGSQNVGADGLLRSDDELRELFAGAGALDGHPVAVYCGGGVGATLDILALDRLGIVAALYPGSFSAWSSDPSRPVATGTEPG